jgi:Domain of unknown function (DUF4390)
VRPVRRHPGFVFFAALWCALLGAGIQAQDESKDRFEIRNAFVELVDDVWRLDVRLDLVLGKAARQAFAEGVPLVLELEVEASTERRYLPDETVVELTHRWQLTYDAISERYVVTDKASGEHASHASEADALEALARISGIEIAGRDTLPSDARFDVRVRASIEIGELPAAVRILLFWKNWSRSTEWYAWSVRP